MTEAVLFVQWRHAEPEESTGSLVSTGKRHMNLNFVYSVDNMGQRDSIKVERTWYTKVGRSSGLGSFATKEELHVHF